MKYNIDKSFNKLKIVKIPFCKPILYMSRIPQEIMLKLVSVPKDIEVRKYKIENNLKVQIFSPKGKKDLPCLLYFHGGGFGFKAAPYHKKLACIYAKKANINVVLPDYRLTPKYPYPYAKEDAINTYNWICENYKNLNVNKEKISVGGDSAGAVLATYICDLENSNICCQMLIYPVTDVKMKSASMEKFTDTPMWNSKNNGKMWELYLKGTDEKQKIEASPMQASLPKRIPNTYIEVAEYDPLHDDGIMYYNRLANNGVKVELNETSGTVHGYDMILNSKITKKSIERRIKFLKEYM